MSFFYQGKSPDFQQFILIYSTDDILYIVLVSFHCNDDISSTIYLYHVAYISKIVENQDFLD